MGLSWESCYTESLHDTSITFTDGNTKDIDHFIFVEDLFNGDVLLKRSLNEVKLLLHGTSINLDFHDVGLLLS